MFELDAVPRSFGSTMVTTMREPFNTTDALVARFGGDEFVALMPKGDDIDASLVAIATTFRDQCAAILGVTSAPLPTVAIGCATVNRNTSHDFAAALREADAAMYAQKSRQRSEG